MESFPSEKFLNVTYLILKQQLPVIDDTLIEKLISFVQNAFQFHVSEDMVLQLMTKLNLSIFEPINTNDSLPEENRAYGIQLIGILGHYIHVYKKEDSHIGIVSEAIRHLCSSIDKKQSSATIRAAGLKMLKKLCCCQEGKDMWITKDVVEIAFKCLADESIFVVKIAQDFLLSVVSKPTDAKEIDSLKNCNSMDDFVIKCLVSELKMVPDSKHPFKNFSNDRNLIAVLVLLKNMINQHILLFDRDIIVNICLTLLKSCSEDASKKACDVLISILSDRSIILSELENIFEILEKRKYTSVKVNFSLDLLNNFQNLSSEIEDRLLSIIITPLETKPEKWDMNTVRDISLTLNSIWILQHCSKSQEAQKKVIHLIICILESSSNYKDGLFHGNLFNRLQVTALDCIVRLIPEWLPNEEMENAFSVMLKVIDNPSTSTMILNKSMASIAVILQYLYSRKVSVELDSFLMKIVSEFSALLKIISKRVLDLRWEVKDSSLELLSHLFLFSKEIPSCQDVLLEHKISLWIVQCLEDTESFVRATALSVLGNISAVNCFWQDITNNFNKNSLYSVVIQLLHNDTEAIVRRSATLLLFQWYTNNNCRFDKEMIKKEMLFAIQDLDWEVKLTALKFWDFLIKELEKNFELNFSQLHNSADIPAYAVIEQPIKIFHPHDDGRKTRIKKFLQQLHENGCCSALMAAFKDYDSPVKEKASQILCALQQNLVEAEVIKLKQRPTATEECEAISIINPNGFQTQLCSETVEAESTSHQSKVLEELVNTDDRTLVSAIQLLPKSDKVVSIVDREYSEAHNSLTNQSNIEEMDVIFEVTSLDLFLQTLEESDIEQLKNNFAESFDLSIKDILDDIIRSTNNMENNILDCY